MAIDSVFDILSDPTAQQQITAKLLGMMPPVPCEQADVLNAELPWDSVPFIISPAVPPQVINSQVAVLNGTITFTVPDSAQTPITVAGLSFHWDTEGTYVISFQQVQGVVTLQNPGDSITLDVTLADVISYSEGEEDDA